MKRNFALLLLFLATTSLTIAQNTPCSAVPLSVNTNCNFSTFQLNGMTPSSVPTPSCGNYSGTGNDIWFVVTVPSNGNIIINTADQGIGDGAMSAYTGANCNSISEIQCDDDDAGNSMPYILETGLTPGTNVWIRVWDFDNQTTGNFDICAQTYNPVPQDCAGAQTICSDDTFNGNSSGSGDFSEINASNGGCMSDEHESSWYFFSPQSSGTIEFDLVPSGGTGIDYDFAIWGPYGSAVCPPTGTPIRCSSAEQGGNTGLSSGAGSNSEGPGAGNPYVNALNVQAGEVYVMLIDNFTADGSTFDLDWHLSGGASLMCSLLDVELLQFNAEKNGSNVDVTWSTASESKTSYFIIERAQEDGVFKEIDRINAKGAANTLTSYKVIDQRPKLGLLYYKLLEVTTDGDVIEHKTVSVNFDTSGKNMFSIYPNPTSNNLYLHQLSEIKAQNVEFQLVNVNGNVVKNGFVDFSKNDTFEIDTRSLGAGFYILKIFDKNQSYFIDRVVIQ